MIDFYRLYDDVCPRSHIRQVTGERSRVRCAGGFARPAVADLLSRLPEWRLHPPRGVARADHLRVGVDAGVVLVHGRAMWQTFAWRGADARARRWSPTGSLDLHGEEAELVEQLLARVAIAGAWDGAPAYGGGCYVKRDGRREDGRIYTPIGPHGRLGPDTADLREAVACVDQARYGAPMPWLDT